MYIVAYFLYSLSKKLVFVPVASTMTVVHRDHLVLASINARWPDIQPLVSRGHVVGEGIFVAKKKKIHYCIITICHI